MEAIFSAKVAGLVPGQPKKMAKVDELVPGQPLTPEESLVLAVFSAKVAGLVPDQRKNRKSRQISTRPAVDARRQFGARDFLGAFLPVRPLLLPHLRDN